MDIIYKYKLDKAFNTVEMPKGARLLTVHEQDNRVHLWAVVNPNAEIEARVFTVVGTGHPTEFTDGIYVGTAFCGPMVWHVFEARP